MITKSRVRNSLGTYYHNLGATKLKVKNDVYVLDRTREFYLFDIVPCPAPRMTKRDKIFTNPNHPDPKKRQRECVTRYFAFKTELQLQAKKMNFELGKYYEVVFIIPMPDSWSAKKKAKMNGLPCETTPDTDNLLKALKDTLRKNDSDIWFEIVQKRWAYKGSIIVFV